MSQITSVAIVHYHLRTGGVTRVIEHACNVLEKRNVRVAILSGEPAEEHWRYASQVRVVPELAYDEADRIAAEKALFNALQAQAREALGDLPDLWHVHNHSLGKNAALPRVLRRLAENGQRLLLQIHDFAEDGRPGNYQHLLRHTADNNPDELNRWLYPQASHVHYALLNGRDRDLLQHAGMEAERMHDLPNAVSLSAGDAPARPPRDEQRRFLYPVRAIRRKNVGELLLWATVAHAGDQFAISQPARSPAERGVYDQWKQFAAKLNLPVTFETGVNDPRPFIDVLQEADALVTTSVAEGFGLTFLEPWLAKRPLVGRNLPHITRDFTQQNIQLPTMYDELTIPANWLDLTALAQALDTTFTRTVNAFGMQATSEQLGHAWHSMVRDGRIEFGRLAEPFQQRIIEKLAGDPSQAKALQPATLMPARDDWPTLITHNEHQVRQCYNLEQYGQRLLEIYDLLLNETSSEVHGFSARAVLEAFLDPENFNFLRASAPDDGEP